jgi:signal transduction histidine kinase
MAMMAKSLRQQLDRGHDVTADDLDVIVCQIQKASKQARALSHSLMPASIEGRSLDEALRQLAKNKQELTGVSHTVETDPDLPRLDETTAVHLYRIAYEAINNAVKHAEPKSIQIRLARTEGGLVVEVSDDGTGIPPEIDPVEGFGLHMMHHRADVMGAELQIHPGEDGGTTVQCALPLEKTANLHWTSEDRAARTSSSLGPAQFD